MDTSKHNEKCENETSNWNVCLALEIAALAATGNTEQQDARNISFSLSLYTYNVYKQKLGTDWGHEKTLVGATSSRWEFVHYGDRHTK